MPVVKLTPSAFPPIHVRNTLVATVGSPLSTGVNVFTITGRVLVVDWANYCTETCVGGAAQYGVASAPALFVVSTLAADIQVNKWWLNATPTAGGMTQATTRRPVDGDIELTLAANLTDGTIVFDIWYYPLTDDGRLAAA